MNAAELTQRKLEHAALPILDGTPFKHFVSNCEITKSEGEGEDEGKMYIGGCISTETIDRQNETVLQKGLDFSEFISHGFFNDDHIRGSILGVPSRVDYLTKGDRRPSGQIAEETGWYVQGMMLSTERAKELYGYAKALASSGTGRKLGFSIEGKILARSGSVVRKALVRMVAICTQPVNTDTYLQLDGLAKAMTVGHENPPKGGEAGDGSPLRAQSLQTSTVDVSDNDEEEHHMSNIGTGLTTHAAFEADRHERHMTKSEYTQALQKSDAPGAYQLFISLGENSALNYKIDALSKSVHALVEASTTPSFIPPDEDLSKSLRQDADGNVDVGEMLKGLVDRVEMSLEFFGDRIDMISKAQVATGHLTAELASGSEGAQMADMAKSLGDLASTVAQIGNNPVVARGATNLSDAAAIARRFQGSNGQQEGAGSDTGNGGQLTKGIIMSKLDAEVTQAMASNDISRLDTLQHMVALAETGELDRAVKYARGAGISF